MGVQWIAAWRAESSTVTECIHLQLFTSKRGLVAASAVPALLFIGFHLKLTADNEKPCGT